MPTTDCVSWKPYPRPHPKRWFIRMYPPTQNAGYGVWHHCQTDPGYNSDLKVTTSLNCWQRHTCTPSQRCGIFHWYWRTASIKPMLLFSSCRLSATWGLSLFSVVPTFFVIQLYCWHKNTNTKRYLAFTIRLFEQKWSFYLVMNLVFLRYFPC